MDKFFNDMLNNPFMHWYSLHRVELLVGWLVLILVLIAYFYGWFGIIRAWCKKISRSRKEREINRLRSQIKSQKQQIEELEEKNCFKDGEIEKKQKDVNQYCTELSALEREKEYLAQQKSQLEGKLVAAEREKTDEINRQRREFEKTLSQELARQQKEIESYQQQLRAKDNEWQTKLDKLKNSYEKVVWTMFPNFAGTAAANVFANWKNEILKNTISGVSSKIQWAMSQLFAWKSAVQLEDQGGQEKSLVAFSKALGAWSEELGKDFIEGQKLQEQFASALNDLIDKNGGKYSVWVPKIDMPFENSKMTSPDNSRGGSVAGVISWAVLDDKGNSTTRAVIVRK